VKITRNSWIFQGQKFDRTFVILISRCCLTDKRLECSVCGKRLSSSTAVKVHMRSHSGHRPYSCNVCNAQFLQLGHLSNHMRRHTGERPYTCQVCQRAFAQPQHLQKHRRLHSDVPAAVSPVHSHRWTPVHLSGVSACICSATTSTEAPATSLWCTCSCLTCTITQVNTRTPVRCVSVHLLSHNIYRSTGDFTLMDSRAYRQRRALGLPVLLLESFSCTKQWWRSNDLAGRSTALAQALAPPCSALRIALLR